MKNKKRKDKRVPWSVSDDKDLKRMLTRKKWRRTIAQAAVVLGRTYEATKKHVSRLKGALLWVGKERKSKWDILTLVLCLWIATAVGPVQAQDTLDPATWGVNALVGNDMAVLRVGFTPEQANRVTVGPEVGYVEGVTDGPDEGALVGFFGTYDLVQNAPLNLAIAEVPVTWYIGVHGDGLIRDDQAIDMAAGLMTGLRVGSTQVAPGKKFCAAIGIEGQYLLTPKFWDQLAEFDDETKLLVSGYIGWK